MRSIFPTIFLCSLCYRTVDSQHSNSRRLSFNPNLQTSQQESLVVQTKHGKVIGKNERTDSGIEYVTFQGIPYAKPPINELRFEVPQRFTWKGVWNATFQRNECVQILTTLPVRGNEDCLYLNIYTKKLGNSNSLKPVMVWVYGGAFLFGSGNKEYYSPDYFVEEDMVVVTLNYRLGVFGFLSTGDEVVPGNNGLKDQIFALKWIQENIAFFGGDPNKVTIMGESAGGVCVGHLIHSHQAEGLFQQAILQSGTSLVGLVSPEKVKTGLFLLGSAFGVTNGNSKDIVEKLKVVDYVSLTLYSIVITDATKEDIFDIRLYAPVLEKNSPSAVITKPPFEQLKKCLFHPVPVIVGFTSEEALSFAKDLNEKRYNYVIYDQNPENLIPKDLSTRGQCNKKVIGNKIKEHYVGKNGSIVFSRIGIIRYFSDSLFMKEAVEYTKLYSNCSESTYLYRFSYNGGKNASGAGHAEELRYLFPSFPIITMREPLTEMETKVKNNIVSLWSNFINFKNPTPHLNHFNVTWSKSVFENNYEYLDINEDLNIGNMTSAPFGNDAKFWESLYNTCGKVDGV